MKVEQECGQAWQDLAQHLRAMPETQQQLLLDAQDIAHRRMSSELLEAQVQWRAQSLS